MKRTPSDIYADGNADEYMRINDIDPADFALMWDENDPVDVPEHLAEHESEC